MKNKVFEGLVVDYTHDGKGIVKIDGYPIFVKDCLIGEEVEVKILKWKKKYGFGKVLKVLKHSESRIEAPCQYYYQCGGCQLQIMNYEHQVNFKLNKIKNAYYKQGIEVDNIDFIKNEREFNYRNKLSIPLGKKDEIYAGLYRENSNDIIKIDKCLIQEDSINKLFIDIVDLLNKYNISIYDKTTCIGYLRQLVIRVSKSTNEMLVGFVTNKLAYHDELSKVINEMIENNSSIKTVVINFNNQNSNVILGKDNKIVYGAGYIIDKIAGYSFKISINSFYQINTLQMDSLYQKAIGLAKLNKSDLVFDAYCGVGTISTYVANKVCKVIGVDIVESSIIDANDNKQLNNVENIDFICQDVAEYMKRNTNKFDCVFVDPPRKGCSNTFLEDLIKMFPKKIVYIACDVATQARDVSYLLKEGYQVKEMCAVDMFSQTYHIENIVLLERV